MSKEAEIARQERRDAEYLRAFAALPPATRQAMARHGVGEPLVDRRGHVPAPPEAREERQWVAPGVVIESALDDLTERVPGLTARQAHAVLEWHRDQVDAQFKAEISGMLYRIVMHLIRPGIDHWMTHWALVYAAGLDGLVTGGKNQTQKAAERGESRATFNHHVGQWRKVLGYSVLKWCRSDEVREVYAERARAVHARRDPEPRLDAVGE